MKTITYIAIGGALLLAGGYLYRINNSQYKIAIVVSGKIHSVSARGVTLRITYNIKNPTDATMRLTPPFIILVVNGKQVATSNMQVIDIPEGSRDAGGKIVIRANKETGDITSEVIIPWFSLIGVAPDVIKRIRDGKKGQLSVKVTTQCQIYTLLGNFPYEQVSTMKV